MQLKQKKINLKLQLKQEKLNLKLQLKQEKLNLKIAIKTRNVYIFQQYKWCKKTDATLNYYS